VTTTRVKAPRPMRVVVAPGSKAEAFCRKYRTGVHPGPVPVPESESIAAGFTPRPALDMNDFGGRIIRDLVFTNFFVGGAASWATSDISNIDKHLSAAMSDVRLNNVMVQYFRGAGAVSTTFKPSSVLTGAPPKSISQTDVEQLVSDLQAAGKLNGFDFTATVFNFVLPHGVVLTIDDGQGDQAGGKPPAKGAAKPPHDVDDKSSSLEGLGGFHGSVKFGSQRVYYAVGVFSEGDNGIVAFDQPWKNVVATFYHELNEARTDADVEENAVAWVNARGEEIGDIPMSLAGANIGKVMKEVPLADGSGTVPIQLMWSNAVHGPEGPIANPHPGH
jgi:hypothetical protein